MIVIGNGNPHAYFKTSHISVPQRWDAQREESRALTSDQMRKVGAIYVGDRHVYPADFRYTLKYRSRIDFTFSGNSYGYMRPSSGYAETLTEGYVEDIVRFDTIFPVYIQSQSLSAPADYYRPRSATDPKYSAPPWGMTEQYRNFSGTEYLIIPPCALYAALPGSGSSGMYGTGIFQQYTDWHIAAIASGEFPILSQRYIIQRTVHSHTTHPVYVNWHYDGEEYTTSYTIRARRTDSPFVMPSSLVQGTYVNTGVRSSAIPVSRYRTLTNSDYFSLGLTYRREGTFGVGGVFLLADLMHFSDASILVGARSFGIYGFNVPGTESDMLGASCTSKAPMFTGTKRINIYDTNWNAGRQDITDWEDPNVDSWSHTDLRGTFEILENNNPTFSSIGAYVKSYFG